MRDHGGTALVLINEKLTHVRGENVRTYAQEEDSELELVVYNFDAARQHKFVGSVVIRLLVSP